MVTSLPAFLAAVVVVSASPGPAVALIIRRTALRGRRYGFATIVGLELGLYVWALLVASGFAVVMASEVGYVVLKAVGCIVLGWLALRSFQAWRAERSRPTAFAPGRTEWTTTAPDDARHGVLWALGEGFTVQMANPKAVVFLIALYSQFVPHGQPLFTATAILGVLQVLLETVLYGGLVLGVARASHWFRRSVVRRRLEAVAGAVLVTLGVRLALSENPA